MQSNLRMDLVNPTAYANDRSTNIINGAHVKDERTGSPNKSFSLFKAPIRNKVPSENILISDAFDKIQGKTFEQETNHLRSLKDRDEAKIFKACYFVYATFSGTFTERAINGLTERSPYICIDLDHIGDFNEIEKIKNRILDNFKPALMFTSPSGDGLKIIYEINPGTGAHSEYFRALFEFFTSEIGFLVDSSGSDISRACFLPHDPDAYYNEYPDILDNAFIDSFNSNAVSQPKIISPDHSRSCKSSSSTDEQIEMLIRWVDKEKTFINGSRNSYLVSLANACNRFGIPENETLRRSLEFEEHGFTANEITAVIRSTYKHKERHGIESFDKFQKGDKNEPRDSGTKEETSRVNNAPSTPILPINGFPFHLQNMIEECVRVFKTHRDYWTISFLQATAVAIGSTYQIKDKYSNGAVLWAGMVGPSGIGKSEPFDIAFLPIINADSKAEKLYSQELSEYNAVIALSPKERKEQCIEVPTKPVQRQYVVVDTTPEGLIDAHQNNIRGIAIVREELMGWISDIGRYNKSGEIQNMLSAWSEKFYKVTRKGQGSSTIKKPFIPIFGGIQPAKLKDLAKDGRALDGFMQRFIFAYPDQTLKQDYNEDVLSDQFISYYDDYISQLLSVSGDRKPVLLSNDAKQLYKDFFNDNTRLVNEMSCEYTRAVYQKLEIIVLRISLILHVSQHVYDKLFDNPIQLETMQAAIEMTEYFRITAEKVNKQIGFSSQTTEKMDNRSVAQHLIKIGKITKSTLATALGTSRSQLDRLLEKNTDGT